ncbi:MAG: imidazole glycerol phosphate synthase subunit HisH [Flavobacteriaceae bacterium]|nr:imidazole glycerol phosphate synthase subunit HisH [Flavobacteriaceae bacterium]|tara:strand:- start:44 stop:673 length:630 start_codon:yes stop_codon:yes gene_type:complete
MKKVSILDYGVGNVKSIKNALISLDSDPILINSYNEIINADFLILPGVGAFKSAMSKLRDRSFDKAIYEFIKKGNPFLGICLGMQILFDQSSEFEISKGLGLIEGKVNKIPVKNTHRLPNIGWNYIEKPKDVSWDRSILKNLSTNDRVYFVHSYCTNPQNKSDIIANSSYFEEVFCAAVQKENVIGVQFHPEKSGEVGLKILNNFINFK